MRTGRNQAENKSIFDYGFGAGTFFRFCPLSSPLFGVEIDSENVAAVQTMLATRGVPNADLRTIDMRHWSEHPLLKQSYDVILCSHVLELLSDPVMFLKRIRECINPGGVFLGLVPINERKLDPRHVRRMDRNKIYQLARAAGFQIRTYLEADPWLYWIQPIFASKTRQNHMTPNPAEKPVNIMQVKNTAPRHVMLVKFWMCLYSAPCSKA